MPKPLEKCLIKKLRKKSEEKKAVIREARKRKKNFREFYMETHGR